MSQGQVLHPNNVCLTPALVRPCTCALDIKGCVFITAGPDEEVLFIGTQFSNLSTAVDTSAAAACNYYYKAVRVCVGGEQWRTCATRDYEPRPVWTSLPITH